MRFSSIGLIVCQIVLSQLDNYLCDHLSRRDRINQFEHFQSSESRYRLKNDYPGYNIREVERKESELPVTFQAPNYKARDYWGYNHEEDRFDHRRTFFENSPYDKQTTFPGFYQFMSSLFKGRDEITPTPETFRYLPTRPTSPHPISPPYDFRITDENFIPPPKPIRASVIKLETITRSPSFYPPFYYDTTTKYSHHLGSILNHVLIENSKKQHHHDLSFHYQHDPEKSGFVIPPPVVPRPVHVPPTTLRPSSEHPKFFDSPSPSIVFYRPTKYNNTDYKYPKSVQDKLPPVDTSDVRIPYIAETTLTDILTSHTTPSSYGRNPFLPSNITRDVIDVKSWLPNFTRREKQINGLKEGFAQPGEAWRNSIPLKKPNKPVELVTNLTVEGLSKTNNDNANIHNYVNYFNMRNLIGYEMRKLEGGSGRSTRNESSVNAPVPVNLNDEFSLDAKILKDTHWDGFTTTELFTTTDGGFTTPYTEKPSVAYIPEVKPTGVKIEVIEPDVKTTETTKVSKSTKHFYEIDDKETTTIPATVTSVPEETTTELYTTESLSFTTEPTVTSTTSTEPTTVQTTNRTLQRRLGIVERVETTEKSFVRLLLDDSDSESVEKTTEKVISIPSKRKYNRRPKIINFTPYPTPDELQRKLINRNNFPKRQKPNITLTFGNKNIIKNRESYAKDEVMKFSDEDVSKRKRKIGKRRQLIKRTRVTSSERSIVE